MTFKYGQPLTKAQSIRLSRLRAAGLVTDDMAGDEVIAIASKKRKPGPKTNIGSRIEINQTVRKRLKSLYNLTPTQLLTKTDREQREIMRKCIQAAKSHGNLSRNRNLSGK